MERLLKDAKAISGENYDISSFNDIVNAIHVIQTQIGITGTTAKEAEHTIQGSLNATKAAYQNLVTGLGDSNADIGLLVGNLVDSFGDVTANIMPVLDTIVGHLPSLLQNMAGPAKAAIGNILDFAFTDLVPGLANFVEGPVTDALDALKKRLPNLVKGLTSALPKLFTNAANLVPGLVDSFSKVAGMAIEGLIGNLPNLVPQLIEGIIGMGGSLVKGLGNLVGSLGKGVDKALKSVGIKDKSLADTINDAFASLDPVDIDSIPIGEVTVGQIVIDGPIDTSEYEQKIQSAIDTITNALSGHKMNDNQKEQITNDIVSGSGVEALSSAIQIINEWVPKTQADDAAKNIQGAVNSINSAMGSFGLPDGTQSKILAYILAGGSTSAALQAFAGIDASKAGEAGTAIDGAMKTINQTLVNFGVPKENMLKVRQAIADGMSVQAALTVYGGLNPTAAENAAQKIQPAVEKIDSALSGLGLDDATIAQIKAFTLQGGDIQTALTTFAGLSAEDAKTAAKKMETDINTVNSTCSRYKITFDGTSLTTSAGAANMLIVAALNMMGADDDQIAAALEAMGTLGTTVSTKVANLFNDLRTGFTDYNTSNDKELAETSKEAMDAYAAEVEAKIDAWAEGAKAQLAAMTDSASEIATKTAEIDAEAARMKETLDNAVKGTDEWIDKNAGAATNVVKTHTAELDAILQTVEGLEARVESLRSSLSVADYSTRTIVEKGMTSSRAMQLQAIQLTSKELEAAQNQAGVDYNNTIDKIDKDFTAKLKESQDRMAKAMSDMNAGKITQEQFKEEEQLYSDTYAQLVQEKARAWEQADADLAKANEEANAQYNKHIEAIIRGMLMSDDGDLNAQIQQVADTYATQTKAADLQSAVNKAILGKNKEGLTAESIISELGFSEADIANIAQMFGMSIEDLTSGIDAALETSASKKSADPVGKANRMLDDLIPHNIAEIASDTLENAFMTEFGEGVDVTAALEVLQRAINEGFMKAEQGGFDWSTTEGISAFINSLIMECVNGSTPEEVTVTPPTVNIDDQMSVADEATPQMETSGENAGQGFANGIASKKDAVIAAASALAGAAAEAMRVTLDEHSPSKVMKSIGDFAGQGFSIGLNDSLGKAVESAQSVVGLLNLKPNMDFSGITGSLGSMVGNLTSAEMSRPIDLYLNGRRMASTMAPYNNYAMNGFNAQTNMGYGRG